MDTMAEQRPWPQLFRFLFIDFMVSSFEPKIGVKVPHSWGHIYFMLRMVDGHINMC